MSGNETNTNSIVGHDTTAKQIREDLPTLRTLQRNERYELLADLYREDSASDAGYFLLGDLIREARMCEGEARLDAYYITGRIQLEALDLEVGAFRAEARGFCTPQHLNETGEALLSSASFARNEVDRLEILKVANKLNR